MNHIRITERPKRVTIVHNGVTHTSRWRESGGNDGELFEVQGSASLLKAALTAWDGPNEFELSDEELAQRSGGWWSP